MTSVRRLADEIASIVDAQEAVLYEKLAASISENSVLRVRLERSLEETESWKRENDETDKENVDIEREMAVVKTEVVMLKTQLSQLATTVRDGKERLAAANMLVSIKHSKIQAYQFAVTDHNSAIAAARAQLKKYATAAAVRDKELADVKAQLATARLRLRDKLQLDILAQRGDLESAAEMLRRSKRDPTADLAELGLAARENDDEEMEEQF